MSIVWNLEVVRYSGATIAMEISVGICSSVRYWVGSRVRYRVHCCSIGLFLASCSKLEVWYIGNSLLFVVSGEDYEKVVFLYQLERGEAGGSYGLNVAALAGLPTSILRLAQAKSKQLQQTVNKRAPGPIANIKSLLNLLAKTYDS